MHLTGFEHGDKQGYVFLSEKDTDLKSAIEKAVISDNVREYIREGAKRNEKLNSYETEYNKIVEEEKELVKIAEDYEEKFRKGEITEDELYSYRDEFLTKNADCRQKKRKILNAHRKYWCDSAVFGNFCDIYDALTDGEIYAEFGSLGHGKKYYSEQGNKAIEIIAQVATVSVSSPELFDYLKKKTSLNL